MYADDLAAKASKARHVANTMFGMKVYFGVMPLWEGRAIVLARVQTHLIHGCDIIPDVDTASQVISNVQHYVLRRLLGLNSRSILAPLFTELNIVPIRFTRLILCLRYLDYARHLPPTHLVFAALSDSRSRSTRPESLRGLGIIAYALAHLDVPVALPSPNDLFREGSIACLIDEVNRAWKTWIAQSVRLSPRLHLMYNRLEPMRQGAARRILIMFRQHLRVSNVPHRLALTRIICGDSRFAVEIMGWASRYREPVDLHLRLCRFCKTCLETPDALFICRAEPQLVA